MGTKTQLRNIFPTSITNKRASSSDRVTGYKRPFHHKIAYYIYSQYHSNTLIKSCCSLPVATTKVEAILNIAKFKQ